MKKITFIVILLLLFPVIANASPPSRVFSYSDGNTIEPAENTANEDVIFNYLSRGVDTYTDSSIVSADISDGTITNTDISGAADIADSKLATISTAGKVSGASLTSLSSIPAGAGIIPSANLSADMSYSNTRYKVGSFTKDISGITGATQQITSIGFTPRLVLFFGAIDTTSSACWGFDSIGTKGLIYAPDGTPTTGEYGASLVSASVTGFIDSSNEHYAYITAVDSDSFTLTWTKIGSPTGTLQVGYIAFR